MNYTKKQLAQELKVHLEHEHDLSTISKWAYRIYLDSRELESELVDILMLLEGMDSSSEFELSEEQLRNLVVQLEDN
ncbi:MAG TPA: hypothetical protein V6C84_23475 [Coleofasciculaceae cyanobacterium]|jgi:hypothetical protein